MILVAGLMLICLGLSILAWVGWQIYGTTWLAHRHQSEVVGATERTWQAERDGDDASGQDRDLAEGVIALVRIPAFGNEYVVPVHAGTDDDVLARGFGLVEGSPAPGAVGNFALAGHRITHGEPLRDMPELEAGDTVEVVTADMVYTYTLDTAGDALSVGIDDAWVTAADPVDPDTGASIAQQVGSDRLLTLVTCAELFYTDDRLVAFGHLTDRRRVS